MKDRHLSLMIWSGFYYAVNKTSESQRKHSNGLVTGTHYQRFQRRNEFFKN